MLGVRIPPGLPIPAGVGRPEDGVGDHEGMDRENPAVPGRGERRAEAHDLAEWRGGPRDHHRGHRDRFHFQPLSLRRGPGAEPGGEQNFPTDEVGKEQRKGGASGLAMSKQWYIVHTYSG